MQKIKPKARPGGKRQKYITNGIIICPKFAKTICIMAKGPEKNTKNKALHTKLLNRKKAKLQEEKRERALRLKALVAKMNEKKNNDNGVI